MLYPPHPDYTLSDAPEPGFCTGCALFIQKYPPVGCTGSGCQPEENPNGTAGPARGYRVVTKVDNKAVFVEATELLAGVRNTDPVTSHRAAAKVKVPTLRQVIVESLAGGRQLNGKEIAAITGRPLNSVTPRFAGLVDSREIRDTGLARDGQTVWALA